MKLSFLKVQTWNFPKNKWINFSGERWQCCKKKNLHSKTISFFTALIQDICMSCVFLDIVLNIGRDRLFSFTAVDPMA